MAQKICIQSAKNIAERKKERKKVREREREKEKKRKKERERERRKKEKERTTHFFASQNFLKLKKNSSSSFSSFFGVSFFVFFCDL